jgi:hypothetical protein
MVTLYKGPPHILSNASTFAASGPVLLSLTVHQQSVLVYNKRPRPPRAKCQLKQAGQASPTSSNAVQLAPRPRRPPRRPSPVRVRDQSGGSRVTGAAPGGRGRARVPVGRGLLGHAPLLRDRPSCEPLCAVKCEGCAYTRECTYKEKCAQQSNCAYACASIILLKHK